MFTGRALLGVLGILCAALVAADPILQSTYIGGTSADSVNAIAIDPRNGDVLVAGHTYSTAFPGTGGGAQPHNGGGVDGFVARFDPTLKILRGATYLGGSSGDEITGIAIHSGTGDVYVCGFTVSNDFPGTASGAQPERGGGNDAFVARLDSTLTRLLGATYIGGNIQDRAVAIALDAARGSVYVTGNTDGSFPGTDGGALPIQGGNGDGFLAKFDLTLTTLVQATYVQESGAPDFVRALALDPSSGDLLVGGQTGVDAESGVTVGFTGFILRIDPTLTRVSSNMILFEPLTNDILGIAVDPQSGDVFLTGWTVDLGMEGGAQPHAGGDGPTAIDGFVLRVDPTLNRIYRATYLGGSENDYGYAIAIHPLNGDVYVLGQTFSSDFPATANGAQSSPVGGMEGFVARLNRNLTEFVQSTYIGGFGDDAPHAMAIQPVSGEILVGGATLSDGFPRTHRGADGAYAGGDAFLGGDGVVSRLSPSLLDGMLECALAHEVPCINGRDPEPLPTAPRAPRTVTRPE